MVRAHSVNILIISYKDIIYYKGLWVTFKKPKYIIQGMIKMNILKSWVNRLKKGHMLSVIGVFLLIIIVLGVILYQSRTQAKQTSENSYNMAFYELVDYVTNVETYLAKSLISTTPEHGAETLTNLWREANLAQSYLSRLPIESQELENTEKFLNQVSEYSYSLSRKNIYNESLTEEDLSKVDKI